MGLEKQGSKPSGIIGGAIGWLMNRVHTKLYVDYFRDKLPTDHSSILDIGCGGGKFIKYLSLSNRSFTLTGLDHSEKMVELSKKINRSAIKNNQVSILRGSVQSIPIEDNRFDLVTAFETIQFWPDLDRSLSEIARVLKARGSFIVINRHPKEGSKWWKIAQLKNKNEYITKLKMVGFNNITTDLTFKKNWIIVKADK